MAVPFGYLGNVYRSELHRVIFGIHPSYQPRKTMSNRENLVQLSPPERQSKPLRSANSHTHTGLPHPSIYIPVDAIHLSQGCPGAHRTIPVQNGPYESPFD